MPESRVTTLRAEHLRASGVSKSFSDRRVLTDVSLSVSPGQRTALIGENGSGKSTLLRILAGVTDADAGEVARPTRTGLLWQQHPFAADLTIAQVTELALSEPLAIVTELEASASELSDEPRSQDRYARALAAAEALGVWDAEHQAELVLHGVGLLVPGSRVVKELSGGEQSRLALAWLLLARPTALLLDEPTNHLDDSATDYLSQTLREWPGPVLFASHDRSFTDEVATGLVDLDPAPRPHHGLEQPADDAVTSGVGVTSWTGSFSGYLVQRQAVRERWAERFEREQAELARLSAEIQRNQQVGHQQVLTKTEIRGARKFYADRNAKVVSRRVNDVRDRLAELEGSQVRRPPSDLHFAGLTAAPRLPHAVPAVVASLQEAAVVGRVAATSWQIGRSEKWLLTGANGSGKSSLLALLAGRLQPTSGLVTIPRQVSVGLLPQEVDLPQDVTVTALHRARVGAEEAERTPLSTFGLVHQRDAIRPVGSLSVGQQRRLALALVLAKPPDLLLLDEPTNHFSLNLVAELESALPSYPGAVVVASHDRWLRRNWGGEHLAVAGTLEG